MIALLLLSGGILGLAFILTRLQTDSRSATHRVTALRLIEDLHARMLLNAEGTRANRYLLTWQDNPSQQNNCTAQACDATALAAFDLGQWRAEVARQLPRGQARIFRSVAEPRQVGIAVAWAANESHLADQAPDYLQPFSIDAALPAGDAAPCPIGAICHVAYIEP